MGRGDSNVWQGAPCRQALPRPYRPPACSSTLQCSSAALTIAQAPKAKACQVDLRGRQDRWVQRRRAAAAHAAHAAHGVQARCCLRLLVAAAAAGPDRALK